MRRNPFVYYSKKALVFLLSVFILSVAVFYISRLAPGDPLMSYYGERVEKMSAHEKEAAREKQAEVQKLVSDFLAGGKTVDDLVSLLKTE